MKTKCPFLFMRRVKPEGSLKDTAQATFMCFSKIKVKDEYGGRHTFSPENVISSTPVNSGWKTSQKEN